ncbi:MAG: ATP-binding cassette domain-containing protein, partial [Gammaproteobacteria bacterium]|nr:ATP-binding cassette domain-containing protein [Gammaproteobacteria bacterium]
SQAKLKCTNLWKIFGDDAEEILSASGGSLTDEELAQAVLIAALRDVSLEINEGEVFVIMGLSGSGKSTLIRCLSLLIEPTAGHVFFEDRDLMTVSEKDLIQLRRHKMGMVFQHFALLPYLTILQNVAFPLEIQGIAVEAREQRAQKMIELVGLDGREHYYPRELSGGQRQRVGIARSLAVEPELWFLDEPFSALDPLIRRELQSELLRLQGLLHKTIVFITHDFEEAIRVADRIAILKDGVVEQIGTPAELVMSPATDYVAEFTQHVPRTKVLSVGSLMRPLSETFLTDQAAIPATASIESAARRIIRSSSALPVEDENGTIIGQVDRETVLSVLFPDDQP